jgi:4-amino-4-deoxy-L-arabinose transferase-like glycosyltransferase
VKAAAEPRAGRVAAALGAAAFLAVALTIAHPGITWDEPGYLAAAKLELAWLEELPDRVAKGSLSSWMSADTLEAYWRFDPYHNPHPPFYKILAGSTWAAFHPLLGDYPAFRLSSAALFGLLVGALCLWGATASGSRAVGIGAAAAFALMPRVFGDAHVAATDMPLTAFWGLAAYFFWRASRGGGLPSVLAFGACWGMALATKFNGLLLPVPLVLWSLFHARRRLLPTLVVGGAVACALGILFNPYLWMDPIGRTLGFISESTSRAEWAPIWTLYLGRVYRFVLPWHHALVLTLITVPLPILALAGAGAVRLREAPLRPLVSLCLIQVLFQQVLMALPSSPGHDGVRLFLPQFPFIALLAGLGFGAAWSRVWQGVKHGRHPRLSRASCAGLTALLFLPAAAALARSHPLELAYFNEVVGGVQGAYRRGFESTYWFDAATPRFLRRMERELPRGARVWAYPAPWHFTALQQAGLLRADLEFTDSLPAPFLLLMTRQGTFGSFQWRLHRSVPPVVAEARGGVPLMALYRWR